MESQAQGQGYTTGLAYNTNPGVLATLMLSADNGINQRLERESSQRLEAIGIFDWQGLIGVVLLSQHHSRKKKKVSWENVRRTLCDSSYRDLRS